jgi:hypothetical protein
MTTTTQLVPGWNGGANTLAELEWDGYYTFQLGQRTGIAIGLSKTVCEGAWPQIEHAFMVQGDAVSIYEKGVKKYGPVVHAVEATTFKIERSLGQVRYSLDNVLLYTSLIQSSGKVWLDAALYAKDDTIIDATLVVVPTQDDSLTAEASLRFAGWAVDDDAGDFGNAAFRFGGSGTTTDLATGDGRIRLFGYGAETSDATAQGRFGFSTSSNDIQTPDTSYAFPFVRFYSNGEALTDLAGTGEGTLSFFGSGLETLIDWGWGQIRFESSGTLAATPPALVWIELDSILTLEGNYRLHEVHYRADLPVLHLVYYGASQQRLHQVSYRLGELQQRLHSLTWTSEGRRLHSVSYEGLDATATALASALHEVFYEGSGISPLALDQRLHEVLYSVIGADSISAASAFHQVTYSVFVPPRALHEVFYKTVVLDRRLHTVGWKADVEQRRLHEVRYHVVDTSTIIEAGSITVGDGGLNAYDFISIIITADEDSPYWQCEMILKDSADYLRFPRDAPFVIRLLDVDFHFIVDSRKLQRSIDDEGNYQELCTISGLSPLALKARPRAPRITETWEEPQLASSIVESLLGPVTWNLVDWTIPGYRLAAERADPFAVAKQVVEAPGGLIESHPDGSVVCRHRWPVSIAALDVGSPDQGLDETVIYAASEAPTQDELIDRVRIYDGEAAFQDRLEYVPNKIGDTDDPRNGMMYAFISPWREGLRIVTTRPSVISVGAASEGTRSIGGSDEYPPEIITFAERSSSTQYPIMTLTSLTWLDENLGAALYTPYSTTLEAGNGSYGGYSLAEVRYVTRYLAVPVRCTEPVEEIEAQFLLLENQDG